MVLAEALCAGLPILASSSGAIPEVLRGQAPTFAPGDWLGLARACWPPARWLSRPARARPSDAALVADYSARRRPRALPVRTTRCSPPDYPGAWPAHPPAQGFRVAAHSLFGALNLFVRRSHSTRRPRLPCCYAQRPRARR